jgi:hypothetical protein
MFIYQVTVSFRIYMADERIKANEYVVRAENIDAATSRAIKRFVESSGWDIQPDIVSTNARLVIGEYLD